MVFGFCCLRTLALIKVQMRAKGIKKKRNETSPPRGSHSSLRFHPWGWFFCAVFFLLFFLCMFVFLFGSFARAALGTIFANSKKFFNLSSTLML